MKNLFILSSIALFLSSFTAPDDLLKSQPAKEIIKFSSITILNDTKESVSIHTGSGFVILNKDSKTSVSCNVGKEVSLAHKGKKTKSIFKITEDMCGSTVRLSDYL